MTLEERADCGVKYPHDQANPHAVYQCPKRKEKK